MAHPSARLTVFSRQLLVKRVVVDGLADGDGRRAAGDQPGDGVQVGPPLSGRRPAWARGPKLPATPLATSFIRRGDGGDHRSSHPPTLWSGPPGPADGPSALDHLRRPAPGRPQPPARHRPGDRAAPVRYVACHPGAPSSTRTTRSSAGCPMAVAGASSTGACRAGSPRPRQRSPRGVRRRRQSLCRRRAGRRRARRERLVGGRAGGRPVRRGRDPDRADAHRQRRELSKPRLPRHPAAHRHPAQADPTPIARRPTARPSASSRP